MSYTQFQISNNFFHWSKSEWIFFNVDLSKERDYYWLIMLKKFELFYLKSLKICLTLLIYSVLEQIEILQEIFFSVYRLTCFVFFTDIYNVRYTGYQSRIIFAHHCAWTHNSRTQISVIIFYKIYKYFQSFDKDV